MPTDKLTITLRVRMTLEGKLAAEPILIEASASPKGPVGMQSASLRPKPASPMQCCQ